MSLEQKLKKILIKYEGIQKLCKVLQVTGLWDVKKSWSHTESTSYKATMRLHFETPRPKGLNSFNMKSFMESS
jgi:hypothetical protein